MIENGEQQFVIDASVGYYEIERSVSHIYDQITEYNKKSSKKIEFEMANSSGSFKSKFKCNYPVDFGIPNSLSEIFGFNKKVYQSDEWHISENLVDINPINSIKVICNIAQGSFSNNQPSHSIHEFFPTGATGTKIVERPSNLIYYKLNTPVIDRIYVELVDQDQNSIHNFREKITVVLHIRRCRYGTDV